MANGDEQYAGTPGDSKTTADNNNTQTIAEIAHILDAWHTQIGRQFGPLSRPQRRMLHWLHEDTLIRVGDLAAQLGLTTAGTTRMLDRLEEMGYVTRARAPHSDQRQVYVTLTAVGNQALLEADTIFLARVRTTLAELTLTECAILDQLLRKLQTTAL